MSLRERTRILGLPKLIYSAFSAMHVFQIFYRVYLVQSVRRYISWRYTDVYTCLYQFNIARVYNHVASAKCFCRLIVGSRCHEAYCGVEISPSGIAGGCARDYPVPSLFISCSLLRIEFLSILTTLIYVYGLRV